MSKQGKKLVTETLKQTVNPTESSWCAIKVESLPLDKAWIDKLIKHGQGAFMIIERSTNGGETYETNCCVTQGQGSGLANMMPIPTHRAMFIGQPEPDSDQVTVTFRYISDIGLKDLTSGENNPIEFEWVDKLPCFPKALAIQEIMVQYDKKTADLIAKDKGIFYDHEDNIYMSTPIPYPNDVQDFVDQYPHLFIMDKYPDLSDL